MAALGFVLCLKSESHTCTCTCIMYMYMYMYMHMHVFVGEYDFRRLQMRTCIQELSRRPGFPANLVFSEVDCFNDKMMATLRKKVKEQISSAQLRGQKIMGGLVPHSYMVSTVYIGEKTL